MKILHVFTLAKTAKAFFDGQFEYLHNAGYELQLATSDIPDSDFCERNHIKHYQVDIARRIDIKADFRAIDQLRRFIVREKFDAVVGHTPKGAMVAMIAARLSGVKYRIYYRHGLIYTTASGLRRAIFKSVERLTSCFANKIVNVSPSLSALAVKDHLNSDKKQRVIGRGTCGGIDTINLYNPNRLNPAEVESLRTTLVGDADFIVGFCGRLCNDKGVVELIDGFKLFKTQHPEINIKLLLIGTYDQRDVLADITKKEIEYNADIIATGRQDKTRLPALYSLMDVFVFPSYREGFGMSVIEASAMKVPILVSRSHGCVDSIIEGATGLYIDLTPESIAQGLNAMLDSTLRAKLGGGGRDFVVNNFEQTKLWPIIKKMYDEYLLAKK